MVLALIVLQSGLIVRTPVSSAAPAQLRRAAGTGQRTELAHGSRLAVAGELTASIAHEINQPLGAIQRMPTRRSDPAVRKDRARICFASSRASGATISGRATSFAGCAAARQARARAHPVDVNIAARMSHPPSTRGGPLRRCARHRVRAGTGLYRRRPTRSTGADQSLLNAIDAVADLPTTAATSSLHRLLVKRSFRYRRSSRLGTWHRAGVSSEALRVVLHDQAGRYGTGALDHAHHRRGARRTNPGRESGARGALFQVDLPARETGSRGHSDFA